MQDGSDAELGGAALAASDSLDLAALRGRYARGSFTPTALVEGLLARIAARGDDGVWIARPDRDELLAIARRLEAHGPAGKPLYGIPFAIKDNIDLAGQPTTAACPAFAYVAPGSAPCVQRLVAAGAIPLGKANLDQFATGLNGTRSPYGTPVNALAPDHIPGGSSSGSAVAVAAGLVSFALGTDTAGSGRVPAAFNNLIGLKPTRGRISTRGVVPACRSLDCVSILALTAADAHDVLGVAAAFDPADPFSRQTGVAMTPREPGRCRFGVPRPGQLAFFGNAEGERRFTDMLRTVERLGGERVEIDFAPFLEVARLLYEGPWIAERYAGIRAFIERQPETLHPITRQIIEGGSRPLAADAFAGYYRLKELRRVIAPVWQQIDVLITPTAGRHYTIAELLADPVGRNTELGYYTNFVNLLDLAAIAVPAGMQTDGLAFGVTLTAPAWSDAALCALADTLHRTQDIRLGGLARKLSATPKLAAPAPADGNAVRVAVCGAHMSGLPLNHQLTDRGGAFRRRCRTAARYRLFALPGEPPARPGLLRTGDGAAIEVEIWELPLAAFGSFVAGIPAPLGIGTIELEDGEHVKGFLCEAHATAGARDISELGGWRRHLDAAHPA